MQISVLVSRNGPILKTEVSFVYGTDRVPTYVSALLNRRIIAYEMYYYMGSFMSPCLCTERPNGDEHGIWPNARNIKSWEIELLRGCEADPLTYWISAPHLSYCGTGPNCRPKCTLAIRKNMDACDNGTFT